jgi:hypothetical protein
MLLFLILFVYIIISSINKTNNQWTAIDKMMSKELREYCESRKYYPDMRVVYWLLSYDNYLKRIKD